MTHETALALTLTIEGIVGGGLLLGWLQLRRGELGRGIMIVLAASLLTHPAAWQANRVWLLSLPFPPRAAIIEVSVALVEAMILRFALRAMIDDGAERVTWARCLVVSFVMNAASFGYGLLRLL
ncbi:MAG: hypothetical protein AAF799_27770 [Myxococcota bacterium]